MATRIPWREGPPSSNVGKGLTVVVMLAALVLSALVPIPSQTTGSYKAFGTRSHAGTLTAAIVESPPVIDGTPDALWEGASPLTISMGVTFRAVYTPTHLYIMATWDDTTESDSRHQWTFDAGAWVQAGGGEDRLAIVWNLGDSLADFNTNGCMVVCHPPQMRTNGPTERADVWHWKASRTNAAGYTDDKWFGSTVNISDPGQSRPGDAKSSGSYKDNKQMLNNTTVDISVPLYWEPDATGSDLEFILSSEIAVGEVLRVDQVLANNTLYNATQDVYLEPDALALIPGYILERPAGSRGDIDAGGVWANGEWTLEMGRLLDTGSEDDIQFEDTSGSASYYFAPATFDDADGDEHITSGSNVYVLRFEQPNLPPRWLQISTSIPSPKVGDRIAFDALATDPERASLIYSWAFGDGSTDSGPSVVHSYEEAGAYTVTLTVSDGVNHPVTTMTQITVGDETESSGLGIAMFAGMAVAAILAVVAYSLIPRKTVQSKPGDHGNRAGGNPPK